MAIQFESRTNCPICKQQTSVDLYQASFSQQPLKDFVTDFYQSRVDPNPLDEAIYHIVECASCGFIYQQNLLNEEGMAALYGNWVDSNRSLEKKKNASARLYRQYAGQMQTIMQMIPGPPNQVRILEFGAGWGYWSRMAQAFGFQVTAVELSPDRVKHARSMGVNVLEALPESGPNYNFIYANQVFEHLPEPLETLIKLRTRLTDNGVVYIRVPDGREIKNALSKSGWSPSLEAIHPLEHINCFTRSSLGNLAVQAGLESFQPPIRINPGSLWGSIKREFSDRYLTTHMFFRNHQIGS